MFGEVEDLVPGAAHEGRGDLEQPRAQPFGVPLPRIMAGQRDGLQSGGAHHCTRGWIHTGVRAEVLDDEDPTTAWIASSRRPEDLALALRAAQAN
ncbi:DUF3093 family protein [Herbaspirillum sp. VT-16-41]|uniref:DUF3093 family protein n=1 Tax=Herbaspirillum sp. VT-16-41 TaxID=1953765 RepID=UPI001C2BD1E6